MSDPTQRVSEVLHDIAVAIPAGGSLPARVRRRARLAMARTALGVTILMAAVAVGGVAAYDGLGARQRAVAPGAEPSHAGDGIAFVSDRDGDAEIYTAFLGEDAATNLTQNDAADVSPAWSPDGSEIAFASDRDGDWAVYVMRADGSGVRFVSNGTHPAWSPDGTTIAFQRDVLTSPGSLALSQIFSLELSTGVVDQMTHDDAGAIQPAWSPDGTRFAYSAQGRIVVADAGGGNERRITADNVDMHPVWGPEGLAFGRETSLVDDHVHMNVFATGETVTDTRQLTSLSRRSVVPQSFSPDGRRLLVTISERGVGDVYVMDVDGSDLRAVVESTSHDAEAAWRPRP